jgi:autotransporter adhesin
MGNTNMATGQGAIALGNLAVANGAGAVAIGDGAQATGDNSIALGAGSIASRPNQIVLGSAATTYSAPGLGSQASRAAQSGSTQFVTSDAFGNLSIADVGPAELQALDTRTGNLERQVAGLNTDIRRAYAGTAIALAMGGTMMPADMTVAMSFNLATYRGQQGFAGSVVARVSEHVWINAGAAGSNVRGSTGGRAGVTIGW